MIKINDSIPKVDIVIFVGDMHFGFSNNSMEWFHRSRDFIKKVLTPILLQAIEKFGKERICLIFVGDQGDNKQSINTYIQNKLIDLIEELQNMVVCHMLVGNHDTPLKNDVSINSNKAFGLMPNVYVHSVPTLVRTVTDDIFAFTPWIGNKEKMLELLAEYKKSGVNYMVGHDEVAGFHYEGKPVEESGNICISDLSFLIRAWFGHIHKKQEKDNILFVGSSYHIKKGEYKNDVGITIYNLKNKQEHFIRNTYSPKFKRISLFDIMNMTVQEANEYVKKSYVTIVLPSNLYGVVDTTKINGVLTGYKDIDSVSISGKGKDTDEPQLDILDVDESLYDKQIDVRSSIKGCVEEMTSIIVNKQSIMLNDDLKNSIISTLDKIYKTASDKSKEQIEF